ncbi:MAG: 23S rRNA (adenine2503-C2)-methyltransferase [Myxococcota bacterium]|jgi:23S rRNA (adenine2503-C2)-methyltransferase
MLTDLYTLDMAALTALVREMNQPAFRAKQLWGWLYERGAQDFSEMSNLPQAFREQLMAACRLGSLSLIVEQRSKDGTVKRLYRLPDGKSIESVLMCYADNRRTACISSQAGCAMGCTFCATGQMGFARHLTADEIFEQAQRFSAELQAKGERLSNVVMMGMGEPLHNYDATLESVRRLMGDLGIGARHITISTVGLPKGIRRFAAEGLQVKLAISLHAATDEVRSSMLPVNRKYPIGELLDSVREYIEVTGRRVTFEWALIAGENDSVAEAARLGRLLKGIKCHVNLIPLNPTEKFGGKATSGREVAAFVEELGRYRIPATVRVRRGIDIDAGCGQLSERMDG